jgi:hypothetical protein
MTDRAEPGATPLTVTVGAIAAAFHEWAGHTHDEACTCHERAEAFWLILATLDTATPRPGLVEALEWLIDHSTPQHTATCAGQDDDEPCICGVGKRYEEVLALASGTGEPGLDRPYVRKLLGDHHRALMTSARNCSICWRERARLANDKGADPTPEPK